MLDSWSLGALGLILYPAKDGSPSEQGAVGTGRSERGRALPRAQPHRARAPRAEQAW